METGIDTHLDDSKACPTRRYWLFTLLLTLFGLPFLQVAGIALGTALIAFFGQFISFPDNVAKTRKNCATGSWATKGSN
jgi:hypothetical protein